jgi:hypothetical protein
MTLNRTVKFTLQNCGANIPRIVGSSVIAPDWKEIAPNAAGLLTGTIVGNDVIECGTTIGQTYTDGLHADRESAEERGNLFRTRARLHLGREDAGAALIKRNHEKKGTYWDPIYVPCRPTSIDLFKSLKYNWTVKTDSVRTSVDLPRDLHRRLHEAAARRGCSARQLILASIEQAVTQTEATHPHRRLCLDPPLVPASGRKPFDLTNEQIYDVVEFP